MDTYQGFHNRPRPDYNGYTCFRVYKYGNFWRWTGVNTSCEPIGFIYGPFLSAKEAYKDAMKDWEPLGEVDGIRYYMETTHDS